MALALAGSLAQIGELSFILAGLGVELKLLPEATYDLILAGAILSILINPLLFTVLAWVAPLLEVRERPTDIEQAMPQSPLRAPTSLRAMPVLVGHGRVGGLVAEALERAGRRLLGHRRATVGDYATPEAR